MVKMKILLISIGTRGDMEPFLAIGELLKEKGHKVICAFPEQFRQLAEESRLEFHSLGLKFIEMLDSEDGKAALGGSSSGLKKWRANIRLARKQTPITRELVFRQDEIINGEDPDRIVYNGKAINPMIWEFENPGKSILISPVPYVHFVKDHTHVAFNSNFGTFLNKLTFTLVNIGMIMTTRITLKWLKRSGEITRRQIKSTYLNKKAVYTISPTLFPRPDYWADHIQVLGYHQRKKSSNWTPDRDLTTFLEKHKKTLFITFGSMTNPDPEGKTRIILEILERNRIPAIINTASGGLVKPVGYNADLIYFVPGIPYEWILPRVYGIIHHGGSGTTHLALQHGCATMIIPHIIDQFVWNRIISDTGAGPPGTRIDRISMSRLEPGIIELLHNDSFKRNAEKIAVQMKKEDFRDDICKAMTGS